MIWHSEVLEAYGNEEECLGGSVVGSQLQDAVRGFVDGLTGLYA